MDSEEYPWSNQTNLVSTLDLLEEEVLREASKHGPHWNHDKQLLVEGEPAVTFPREVSRISPRKPSFVPKSSSRRRPSSSRGGDRNTNNAEEEEGSKKYLQLENEKLQHEIVQWQREVEHAREEKLELEASFRRLDQEIGSGYHLAERKEKELRIAELVTKNQKMSQLLEKELQSHEELRRAHSEQQNEFKKLKEQVTLLNQVLDSVETKYAELSKSDMTLTASYEAAQTTIENLQLENHALQDKLATSDTHVQIVTEYEEKIQQWERTCRELERKCDHKTLKLSQTQQIASAAQQEAHRALHRQEELEQELRSAHDQMIQTNAVMRAMEAKLEANLKSGANQESLHRRIQQLEGELVQKNRVNAELMQNCNHLLGSQKRVGTSKSSLSNKSNHAMATRVAKLTTRITSLTDKLRSTEEDRDRKTRSVDMLMQAFPFLLHRLDALQDRFAAAVESNDILKSALEQMQDPPFSASSGVPIDVHDRVNYGTAHISGPMYLHLAREKYLLEVPYPIELLSDQTGAQALNGKSGSTPNTNKKRFSPFRVTCSTLKLRDNQHEDENDDQAYQLVMLSADSSDTSGASYLNRSKINAFLEVIQSSAARKKFKTLLIGKLAECLNKLRELSHRSASEAAAYTASIQLLQREVVSLQHKLKNCSNRSQDGFDGEALTTSKTSQDVGKMRHFLLKVVDVYAEKQQESDQRQMTFLTQPMTSDMLIAKAHLSHGENNGAPDDRLCLSECDLNDDDVGQLLLKVLVSGVRFREIVLDSNNFSDVGAQHVADFLEKAPSSVRVVSFTGNTRITSRGVELIRRGLLNNQRVQRVKEDDHEVNGGIVLYGLALQRDFDVTGNATKILRVVLPTPSMNELVAMNANATTSEAVDALTGKLHQLGFIYNVRPASSSRVRSTTTKTCSGGLQNGTRPQSSLAASSANFSRRASVPCNSGTSLSRRVPVSRETSTSRRKSLPSSSLANTEASNRRQQIKTQQELRFQSLEAAIRRASVPSSRFSSSSRGVSARTNSKRTFSRAHVDTIRGLRR